MKKLVLFTLISLFLLLLPVFSGNNLLHPFAPGNIHRKYPFNLMKQLSLTRDDRMAPLSDVPVKKTKPAAGQFSKTATVIEDAFEPNNSKEEAWPLAPGSYANLGCNDDDWFKVTAAEGDYLYVALTSAATDADIDLIFDINDNWIYFGNSTCNEYGLYGPLTAGDYHILVDQFHGTAVYNLNISLLSEAQMGRISGRATNGAGNGIPNTSVSVHLQDDEYGWSWGLTWGYTDADGYYTFFLPPGEFKVKFVNAALNYQTEWYADSGSFSEADGVTVTVGNTTSGIDIVLAPGAAISGKVTNTAAIGIAYVLVLVFDLEHNEFSDNYAVADANGDYFIGGLPTGSYKVFFNRTGYYISEWYNNKGDFTTADPVAVIAGIITPNIDAQLATGGRIFGKVTNTSAVGIQNIRVYVYDLNYHSLGSDLTNASGYYWVYGLPVGNSKVFFNNNGQYYVSEWYSDKVDFNAADQVTVTADSTTPNINAELAVATAFIAITAPNGGVSWKVGEEHYITWISTGTIVIVNIDYSIDSGSNWIPVVAGTANDGSYAWTIPNTPSTTCLVRVTDAIDNDPSDSSNSVFTIAAASSETVSVPSQPAGANSGMNATSYPFTTGGSISNLGHAVQYKIDWNDGSDSGWLTSGATSASHSWAANGTYDVRAMARCVTHTTIESLWSETHAITISDSGTLGKYNSPAQQKVLPEVIWAAATGGGTWMSEVQVTDISGGSQVSVYYSTSAGRRGPFVLWNNSGGALRSVKYSNMLETIDGLDSGVFTYYGTVGAVEFVTQDAAHVLQVMARTLNGSYSKTFPGFSVHDSNTADISRAMSITNLTNNSTYRSTIGMFNPTADAVTVELQLRNAANGQIGTTLSKTINGYGFSAFSPFNDAGRPYPAYAYDNVIVRVQPISGSSKVLCFGASANNITNDPAAHIAVQNSVGHDNGPSDLQILPEAIWATATGGGTWMSEAQIIDVTGGSMVSVYFDYGAGSRRGPFTLWTGGAAGSKVKYANILQQIGTIDSGLTYYGRVGTVEFQTQDNAHHIQITARTLNGNYSKTFPGLNLVDAETADTGRLMLIQNYASNSTYRSTCGFFNQTANALTVEFTLLNNNGVTIGTPFSKTFVGYDFQAFLPFTEAGVPYPANSYDNVILRVRPTSGTGQVICFGASANNASNDPAAHIAVQGQ